VLVLVVVLSSWRLGWENGAAETRVAREARAARKVVWGFIVDAGTQDG